MSTNRRIAGRPAATARLVLGVGAGLLRRPALWCEALRQSRWLASAPYRQFRAVVAYGDAGRLPSTGDVLDWLAWARSLRHLGHSGRHAGHSVREAGHSGQDVDDTRRQVGDSSRQVGESN